jgi:hypothetical protein
MSVWEQVQRGSFRILLLLADAYDLPQKENNGPGMESQPVILGTWAGGSEG